MKKVIALFTAFVMLISANSICFAAGSTEFSDVPDDYWAVDTIREMAEKGIVNGFDGKFLPDDSVKRSEIVKIILETEKQDLLKLTDKGITAEFSDVKESDWFYKYIGRAVATGIIKGNDLNEFLPEDFVTREEFVTIIARIYLTAEEIEEYKNSDILKDYTDSDKVADFAKGPMAFCVEKGIVNGVTETELAPQAGATRAEACTIIMRAVKKLAVTPDSTSETTEVTDDNPGEITPEEPDRGDMTKDTNFEVIKEYIDGEIVVNTDMYVGGKTDFKYAEFVDTTIDENGDVVLLPGKTTGYFTSPVIKTKHNYSQAMMSWNAKTSDTTWINPEFAVVKDGEQSKWFPFGKSTTKNDRGTGPKTEDSFGIIYDENVDVRVASNQFRYQVKINRETAEDVSPKVSRVSVAFEMNTYEQKRPFAPGYVRELDMEPHKHSQLVEGGLIANNICSPTSISMLLGYQGINRNPVDVAWGVRDYNAEMFGVWVYNIAYAGEQGVKSYVRRCHGIEDLKYYISRGIPVACSISVPKRGDLTGFGPNGESSTTPGHLVVISGFAVKSGITYVVCYDPFSASKDKIRRLYRADQFEKCWGEYAVLPYITYVLGE